MASDPEPLDPALAPIVDELKNELREAPSGSRARVRARIDGSIGIPPPAPPSGGALSKGIALATFVAGIAVGAAWSPRAKPVDASPAAVVSHVPVPRPVEDLPAPSSLPSMMAPVVATATTSASSASNPAPRASAEHDDLAEERGLLDAARTALLRRDSSSTLAMLQKHASKYPNGRLAEERDAMTVQALALAGKTDDAKKRRDAFEKRYPQSLFLPSVRAATEAPR